MQIHFVGIGGIGMSGIARVLVEMGYKISGSDLSNSEITKKLKEKGVQIHVGHSSKNVNGADMVVVSSAIPQDNPEVEEAQKKKIPILQRAEMLGFLMKEKFGIAVAGTHGKTTTTSMIATILEKNGKDPTVVIGGELNGLDYNGKFGKGKYLVAEADESDASFLKLSPQVAVVTNIGADVNLSVAPFAIFDFDYEKTLSRVQEIFFEFLSNIPRHGSAILCSDCPNVKSMASKLSCSVLTYGLEAGADLLAHEIKLHELKSSFEVRCKGKSLGVISLQVPGEHNVLNSLAALGTAMQLGITFQDAANALREFQGVKRRFQVLGEVNDILVVDDYAHNPTKIMAALAAAKGGWNRRTVAVFQPHRFTRTKFLTHEFAHAFSKADVLFVTEVYSAGEPAIPGVKGEILAEQIRQVYPDKPIYFFENEDELLGKLLEVSKSGDLVMMIGAGDIHLIGARFYETLKNGER